MAEPPHKDSRRPLFGDRPQEPPPAAPALENTADNAEKTAGRRTPLLLAGLAVLAWRHRHGALAAWLFVALASLAAAAMWLRVDTDPARMINPDLGFRQDYRQLVTAFPLLDNAFVIVVEGPERDGARNVAQSLVESFRARPDLFTGVLAPALSPMFEDYGPLWMSVDELTGMVGRLRAAAPMLNRLAARPDMEGLAVLVRGLRQAAAVGRAPPGMAGFLDRLGEAIAEATRGHPRPFDWRRLGGDPPRRDDRTRIAILVKPRLDFSALDPAAAAMNEARRITSDPEALAGHDVRIWLTGEAAMNAEEFSTVTTGAVVAGLLSFAIVALTVLLGMPSRRLVIPALALIVTGFALNAGFATLAVGELNMISVAFAVLFIGLGVDYAVHYLLRWSEECRRPPHTPPRPEARAAAATGPALALSAATTVAAFLAFTPTDFVGMAQLGVIAAGGIVIALLASLTLLPAVLGLMKVSPRLRRARRRRRLPISSRLVLRLRAVVTILVLVATAAVLPLLPQVRFDGDPIDLKDPETPSVIAFRRLAKEDPALVYAISALLPDRAAAELLVARLRSLPEVGQARTILSYLPPDQPRKLALLRTLRGRLPAKVRHRPDIGHARRLRALRDARSDLRRLEGMDAAPLPLRRAAARVAARIDAFLARRGDDERAVASLETALFVRLPELLRTLDRLARTGPLSLDNMDAALKRFYVTPDGRWRVEITPASALVSETDMRAFVRAVRRLAPHASGAPVEIVHAADVVARSMGAAVLLALVGVIVIILLATRDLHDTLLVLAPITIAAVLLLGYTVLFDAPFNFANVIVIPLLLGLGVDSAIHYLHRAREARSGTAVATTTTPRAILVSMLTTLGSFGTLWVTPHRGLSSMGELLTMAILLMMLTTLVVMPQLIDWAMARKRRGRGA